MEFVEEQKKIIESEGKNILVSASAGSGKTFTMLNKVFYLLKTKQINISKILLLTYTNSAASEMKTKLFNLINSNISNYSDKKFLLSQIDSIPTSCISTFHSFYEKLIKEYYFKLDINPVFSIANKEQLNLLKIKAFENAVEIYKTKKPENFEEILNFYTKNRKIIDLKSKFDTLNNFLTSISDKQDWLSNKSVFVYDNLQMIFEQFNSFVNNLIDNTIKNLNALFNKAKFLDEDKILKHISESIVSLEEFKRKNFESKLEFNFAFPRLVAKNANEEIKEKLAKIKKNFKNNIEKFKINKFSGIDFEKTLQSNKKYILNFIEFYCIYENEFLKQKKKNSLFDFSDLENFAFMLLSLQEVREELHSKFDFVFVDEYQDVNGLQDKIIDLLAKNNNVFLVGDPKQSIYAFRQSDVELFNARQEKYAQSNNSECLSLTNNYRSNCDILDFCNIIFKNLITENTMKIDYKAGSMFQAKSKIVSKLPSVNLILCENFKQEKIDEKLKIYSIKEAKMQNNDSCAEAECVAEKISNLISEEIYDEKLNAFRKVEFGDIAVLVRSREKFTKDLISNFNKYHIPYAFNVEVNLKNSKEVLAVISLLKYICAVGDEADLLNVLIRFFSYSLDFINELKIKNNFANLNEIFVSSDEFKSDREKLVKLKKDVEISGLFIGLNKFLEGVNFCKNIENDLKLQVFNSFLQYILKNDFNFNVFNLIYLFENSEEILIDSIEDCGKNKVIITTIHASKGLEYPIVFLSDLAKEKNSRNSSAILNKNLGLYLKEDVDDNVFIEEFFKLYNKNKEISENLRLLYVGMTRAKNMMFLTANASENYEKIDENNIYFTSNNFANLIVGSLDESLIDKINNKENFCENYLKVEFYKQNQSNNLIKTEINNCDNLQNIIKKYENFQYNTKNLAQKTTVTNLNIETTEHLNSSPKTFKTFEYSLDENLKTGVLYHSILEKINFSAKDLLTEVKDVVTKHSGEFDENVVVNDIYKIAKNIKKLTANSSKIYKEKPFMLYVSPLELLGEGIDEKVLVQGQIDLFAIGEKNVLIDYKYSNLSDDVILKKYFNQLKIYKFAIENCLNLRVDSVFIINIKTNKIIEIK